jgi:hypothetical protein
MRIAKEINVKPAMLMLLVGYTLLFCAAYMVPFTKGSGTSALFFPAIFLIIIGGGAAIKELLTKNWFLNMGHVAFALLVILWAKLGWSSEFRTPILVATIGEVIALYFTVRKRSASTN